MSGVTDRIVSLRKDPSDQALWTAWYKAFFPRIFFIAYRLTSGNRDAARDLTQEAFARFIDHRVLERVLDERHALAFLAKTCRNLAIDEFGRSNVLKYVATSEELESFAVADERGTTEEWDWQLIEKSVGQEELQLLSWLRQGEKLADIAMWLGISYSAAGVRVHRLKQQLRQINFAQQ